MLKCSAPVTEAYIHTGGQFWKPSKLQQCQICVTVAINLLAVFLRPFLWPLKSSSMWTVSAVRGNRTLSSISHWILLICANHALILRYRAASPILQETLQIDIWQLGGEEVGAGFVFHFPFLFPLSICDPESRTRDLRDLFLLWLWMLTAESVPLKLLLTAVSVTNREMNKEMEQCLSHFSTLCTPSVLEGK